MSILLSRAGLPLAILIGVAAACASGGGGHPAATPARSADNEPPVVNDPIVRLMQTRSPGLSITRTADGGVAVQVIKGQTSFYGSSEPLYILDGVPFRPGAGGALVGVNPYDIDSIKLLTKPEDVGIYGVRGANGVVVITTKKPGKS